MRSASGRAATTAISMGRIVLEPGQQTKQLSPKQRTVAAGLPGREGLLEPRDYGVPAPYFRTA
jgi:hypothetical protein